MKTKHLTTLYLKFHARLIIAIVAFSTFLFSHLLLKYEKMTIVYRYPIAAIGSYLVFLTLMHFWKTFLEDLNEAPPKIPDSIQSIPKPELPFRWNNYVDALDFSPDIEDFFISIAVIILAILLFYTVGLVIFEIPALMIDLVLSGLASSFLIRSVRKADHDIFVFKLFRQTALSGLTFVLVYVVVSLSIHSYCPTAMKFSDLFLIECSASN